MAIIKKTFLFGVVLPVLVAFVNYRFSSITFFEWGHSRINEISILAFVLAFVFCILVVSLNYKSKASRRLWYVLPIILAVVSLLYIYTIYSLSSFGF